MKIGDLVKEECSGIVGVVTRVVPFGFYVLFPDGEYRVHRDSVEMISAAR